jgi:hypothetical protein
MKKALAVVTASAAIVPFPLLAATAQASPNCTPSTRTHARPRGENGVVENSPVDAGRSERGG